METNTLLQRVYDATRDGLDIILDIVDVDDEVINGKKAFRFRQEERTPSAHLYGPNQKHPYWHVKDYGMGEGGGWFSPIDLYMWHRGYSQRDFRMAIEELAERYGVQDSLSASVNKPVVEQRAAAPDEVGALPSVTLFEGVGGIDLSCWGSGVKAEHLETYGWLGVSEVRIPAKDKVWVRRPTPMYPIFAQCCDYIGADGQMRTFYKVYEPLNPNKAHRFLIAGVKPKGQNYIYGLNAVRRAFEERGEAKLPVLLLVSGGSDAICALSRGYMSVWLDSEVKGLSEADYWLLRKYADSVVNIPDIDSTGIRAGQRLALSIPDIQTAWMRPADMGGLHDNRGRLRKDLRDFCHLHPQKADFERLVSRAVRAKFWVEVVDKDDKTSYSLSLTSLNYFLELNGFFTLKDETCREPVYIRIDGIVVRRVTAKAIVSFLRQWMEQQGLPKTLQDKVLRSRDLPNSTSSTLRERDDLDFRKGTATAQYFHFRNCWVEVKAEGITTHRYSEAADHYVWAENIIQHDYSPQPDMFRVTTDEDGRYVVELPEGVELSKFQKFVINTCRLHWRKVDEFGQELTPDELADEHLCMASRLANIGYQLTSHKSESEAWATICMDSTLAESEEECNGRSGKSFYYRAVAKMAKTFVIDAGNTSFRDPRFIFDGVTADTDLVLIDECPRRFNYNFIYGLITGDFRVEEKNRHSYVIPFESSPKFCLGTNFTLPRHDPSTEGRTWPQPFSDYYHVRTATNNYRETRTIRDDFGQNLMGTEYEEADWQRDFAFMTQCVRFYLSLQPGQRRISAPMSRIELREQMAAVGKDFKQWADDFFAEDSGNLDCALKAEQVLGDFNSETRYNWSPKRLIQHLRDYCQIANHIQCMNPASVTGKKSDGERWVKRDENNVQKSYYYVQTVKAAAEAQKQEPEQTSLTF